MKRRTLFLLLVLLAIGTMARAQGTEQREQSKNEYTITVESRQPSGIINEMLYGQLFEHISKTYATKTQFTV